MKKRFLILVLIMIMGMSFSSPSFAHGAKEHWEELSLVLYGVTSRDQTNNPKAAELLEVAASLAIDQFSNNWKAGIVRGEDYLDTLRKKGDGFTIYGLPLSVEEINLWATASTHQKYTHQGWDYLYECDDGLNKADVEDTNWAKRREIMLATAEAIFDFNESNKDGAIIDIRDVVGAVSNNYNEKCQSFCVLIYCVHVLGDHRENEGIENHDVISIDEIIEDLCQAADVLFASQSRDCDKLKTDLEELVGQDGTAKARADKVFNVLNEHVPDLLENEEFFSAVFYPDEYKLDIAA